MISNEQRAHDLAIFMLKGRKEEIMREALENDESQVSFDVFNEYMTLYTKILRTFNQVFPSND